LCVTGVQTCALPISALTLAAVDPCYCCTERMAAFEDGKMKFSGKDLLRLSWAKTERIKERMP
jgi:hypothetical protein